jgi:hypothetical protein
VLTPFDDYPLHQTPEPLAHPGTSDRNFYDRYFFNGYTADASLFFAVALGVYPNRRVMDAAVSAVIGGRQHCLHASRLAPDDRSATRVGPIAVEVEAPMRRLRVRIAENELGLDGDLVFTARTTPVEEPRFTLRVGSRVGMDATRLTQFGRWSGRLRAGGETLRLEPSRVLGCRDRSWGIRPVGERETGAPGPEPQFFWLWAPVQFDDLCTHFDVNEDASGRAWHANGNVVRVDERPDAPPVDEAAVESMARVAHAIRWQPGTRRAASATLTLTPHAGPAHAIELEPLLAFQMLGIGYLHPEWGHGLWKGTEAVQGETFELAKLHPLDPRHLHVQQLCRARLGARQGLGVLEQLVIGPHAPSGFTGLLDGAR